VADDRFGSKADLSRERSVSVLPLEADIHQGDGYVSFAPQAEVKRHAITSTTLNDTVQSLLGEVSDYRYDAFMVHRGLPAIRKPFELNEVWRQRRNDVAVSPLARIPDSFS
jgi:hypothetical protein